MSGAQGETPERNAYAKARVAKAGCQHQLGCKCDVPYWLRESTPAELRYEAARLPTFPAPGPG